MRNILKAGSLLRFVARAEPFMVTQEIFTSQTQKRVHWLMAAEVLPKCFCQKKKNKDDLDGSHVWGMRARRTLFKHKSLYPDDVGMWRAPSEKTHLAETFPTWQRWWTPLGFKPPLEPNKPQRWFAWKKNFISCNTQGCYSEVSIHSDLHFIQEVSHSVLKCTQFTKY